MGSVKKSRKECLCKGCGEPFAVLSVGPGRPRLYCSPRCRRDFHYRQERVELERRRAEERERWQRAYEERVLGGVN